jgi:hypothetical protein
MTIAMRLGRRYSGEGSLEKIIFMMKCTAIVLAIPIINTQITDISIGVRAMKPFRFCTTTLKSNATQRANSDVKIKWCHVISLLSAQLHRPSNNPTTTRRNRVLGASKSGITKRSEL